MTCFMAAPRLCCLEYSAKYQKYNCLKKIFMSIKISLGKRTNQIFGICFYIYSLRNIKMYDNIKLDI